MTSNNQPKLSNRILKARVRHKDLKKEHFRIESTILNPNLLQDDSRPYANVELFGETITGLMDSGANITILGSGCIEFLKKHDKSYNFINSAVKTAGGNSVPILGKLKTNVSWRGIEKPLTVYVAPGLSQKLYLGFDFFKQFGLDQFLISELEENDPNMHKLSCENKAKLESVVEKFPSFDKFGLGKTSLITHKIDTGEAQPIKRRYYPISPAKEKLVYAEVDRMLALGVIEVSKSSWSSPVAAVVKPGKVRLCIDSRAVNKVTKKDAYPIPNIEGLLMRLSNTCFISALDLKDAFWQIPLEEGSKEKTAFTIAGRPLYQFNVMPFGLCNAPQTMSRLMDVAIPSELRQRVFVYLDDLLVFSDSFEEHLVLLERVAECFVKAGLTLNVKKSKFCMREVNYLGYIVGEGGIRTNDEKVASIRKYPEPKTVRQVRRFLGMANYYRKFVKNYSALASPLHDLTKKGRKFEMTLAARNAMEQIKLALTTAPVLIHPDYSKPFLVQCDASVSGIGAVLCQLDKDGEERPIFYYSHKLNKAQRNYSITELECLAAVSAVKKFRPYLEMQEFKIVTDHSSLRWLMNQKDLSGRLARWSLSLSGYNFEIEHRKGSENIVPDALSRCLENVDELDLCVVDVDLCSPDFDDEDYSTLRKTILDNQECLPDLKVVEKLIFKKTEFSIGIESADLNCWKLWIPGVMTEKVIQAAHCSIQASHGGIAKTLDRIRSNYYWPNMACQVRDFVSTCDTCKSSKSANFVTRLPMSGTFISERPFQRIFLDFLGPYPKSKSGNSFILVVLDGFSKFTFLHPLKKATTSGVVKFLRDTVLSVFGCPEVVVSDNGRQFTSNDFSQFLNKYSIQHMKTPLHSPQCNASERVNRSIVEAIRAHIGDGNQNEWDTHLPEISTALRSALHSSIGISPYYALFGRKMIVHGSSYPILKKLNDIDDCETEVVSKSDQMKIISDSIVKNLNKAFDRNCKSYNLRSSKIKYVPGQIVFRKNFQISDSSKQICSKLTPKYVKAKIVACVGKSMFKLANMSGKPIGIFHSKDLKP